MINWQNGVTPINENNMNKLIQEDDNPLLYKGNVPVSDLNDLTEPGIYYTSNLTLANAPVRYQYHYVEVIGFSGAKLQRLVNPDQHFIAIREYSGSPAHWTDWDYINKRDTGTITSNHFTINQQRLQKVGNVISFFLDMTCTTAITNGWTQEWTIFPEGFRPFVYTLLSVATGNQSSSGFLNKTILISVSPGTGHMNGAQNFAVGDHIQFSGTFLGG